MTMTQLSPICNRAASVCSGVATHRGIKEMDLMLGGFAKPASAPPSRKPNSTSFEDIIELPDQEHAVLGHRSRHPCLPNMLRRCCLNILELRP